MNYKKLENVPVFDVINTSSDMLWRSTGGQKIDQKGRNPSSRQDGQQALTGGNKGSNQGVVRGYNERLILQLLRWNKHLTKAEIGRATDLSPNAVSVIVRALEDDKLVIRGDPFRGRIGQPSTPLRLNPNARHYLGCKIGRRSADLVLIDFQGKVLGGQSIDYTYPEPEGIKLFLKTAQSEVLKKARTRRNQIYGYGIAMPSEIWSWADDIGIAPHKLDVWRDVDPKSLVPTGTRWTPIVVNDATAACVAETTFARTGELQDAIYLFVGTLIGGGVILNGSVFFGRSGNAGGFGPFRVSSTTAGSDRLIDQASLVVLDRMLETSQAGISAEFNVETRWSASPKIVDKWLELAARGIAQTVASSLAVIDFQAVILDGSLPGNLRREMVRRVNDKFLQMDLQGLIIPDFSQGNFGPTARAIGAAAMPLNQAYAIDQNTLMRSF